MKYILLTAIISVCLTSSFLTREKNKQDYDMYCFSIQWGETMCLQKGGSCYEKLEAIPANKLSIHGLWPNRQDGSRLDDCHTGTDIPIEDDGSEIFQFMNQYWPSLTGPSETFWTHEYNKHGYCYSEEIGDYDYKLYFEKAREIFQRDNLENLIIDALGDHPGEEISVSKSELLEKINSIIGGDDSAHLVCTKINKKYYLSEIRLNYDLDFNFIEDTLSGGACTDSNPIIIKFRDE